MDRETPPPRSRGRSPLLPPESRRKSGAAAPVPVVHPPVHGADIEADTHPPESRETPGPPSRATMQPPPPQPPPSVLEQATDLLVHFGQIARMSVAMCSALFKRPFEIRSTLHQMEMIGVKSAGLASVTAVFVGMVMAVQFAFGLQKFGGMEYTGRIIGLSFARELAPALTAVIVGGRIGSGIAAEVGSMAVTEQIDAIRALGADPVKKLVVPRVVASVLTMPVLCALSLVLGFGGAMLICSFEFDIPPGFFLRTALGSVNFKDYISGMYKTPIFGGIIAITGCHFGLITRGGTEGVGQSTTRTVVAISIAILVADFLLTKVSVLVFPGR